HTFQCLTARGRSGMARMAKPTVSARPLKACDCRPEKMRCAAPYLVDNVFGRKKAAAAAFFPLTRFSFRTSICYFEQVRVFGVVVWSAVHRYLWLASAESWTNCASLL